MAAWKRVLTFPDASQAAASHAWPVGCAGPQWRQVISWSCEELSDGASEDTASWAESCEDTSNVWESDKPAPEEKSQQTQGPEHHYMGASWQVRLPCSAPDSQGC